MASQALYRKWRSQTFSDFIGQEAVVHTLKNALKAGKLAHAYLFTGPRGTGKTSTARLLAKAINCLQPEESEPCNKCQQCREITAGNSFNVIEIDAASNRGIDSIRELREKVMVPPATGKYKIYILDEAHMLTVEAFNALLKTLEEPPAHAIFVMATTDVHKMLPTVLSRCQRFDFKRFTTRQIVGHLNFIAEQEHVTLESGAAALIARAASGGMRDALSLLDQAMAYSGQEISLAQVQTMLGVADPRAIQKLILRIAQLDSSAGLHLIHALAEAGADLRQINTQVAEYWRAMMLSKAGAHIAEILDVTEDEIHEITEVARYFVLEEVIECARIFAQNELMQKNQAAPQLGLELALLSCIELHRRAQSGQAVTSVSPAVNQPAQPAQATQSIQPQQPSAPARPRAVSPAPPPPEPQPKPAASVEALTDVPASDQEVKELPALTVAQVKEKWEQIRKRVKTRKEGSIIGALLKDYTVVAVEGTDALPVVIIKAISDFHYKTVDSSKAYQGHIEWALKIELGQQCRLRLLPPTEASPPARNTEGRSANTMTTMAPQKLVPLAQPVTENSASPSPFLQQGGATPQKRQESVARSGEEPSCLVVQIADHPLTLARMQRARENSNTAAKHTRNGETRQALVEKMAKGDPVVKEVVRLFKAQIKDIRLK
jgi:DNA polymerase-3 subunit gamma/tau